MAKVGRAKRWYLAHARHQALNPGPASNVHDLTAHVDDAYLDCTVVRVRGVLRFHTLTFNAGDVPLVIMGIIVVSAEAFAAGAGSMPNPADFTTSADWLWHGSVLMAGSSTDWAADGQVTIDNKSMRIMHQANKKLVLIIRNDDATDSFKYSYSIRSLLLLR